MVTRPHVLLELQTAVQSRLTGDSTLMGMINGIFEEAQHGTVFPYISYGQHVDGSWPVFGHSNHEGYFLMHIWSTASAADECYNILAEVKRLLADPQTTPLALPHYGLARMYYEWGTVMRDQDDFNIWHMPIRFLTQAVES